MARASTDDDDDVDRLLEQAWSSPTWREVWDQDITTDELEDKLLLSNKLFAKGSHQVDDSEKISADHVAHQAKIFGQQAKHEKPRGDGDMCACFCCMPQVSASSEAPAAHEVDLLSEFEPALMTTSDIGIQSGNHLGHNGNAFAIEVPYLSERSMERSAIPSNIKAMPVDDATAALKLRAWQDSWLIPRSDLDVGDLLLSTNKSNLYVSRWKGLKAVAKFPKEDEQQEWIPDTELLHDIHLLAGIRHPDLVLLLGACLDKDHPPILVTEYMEGGDLENYYRTERRKRQALFRAGVRQVITWALAVARALWYLHYRHPPIIHRDLKPLNVLLTKSLQAKVTDFGTGRIMERTTPRFTRQLTGGIGSWLYMAPEVVRHEEYNEKADIYSFGMILFFMSSGRNPFHDLPSEEPDACLKEFQKGREPRPNTEECYAILRPIMKSAWHVNPTQRPLPPELVNALTSAESASAAKCSIA